MVETTSTLIVGAGPAGLATAACLARRGVDAIVLEKGPTVAPAWHNHYERLHLHTPRGASELPFRRMPRSYPRYPSRDQVADYLADYAEEEQLDIRLGSQVTPAKRKDSQWIIRTTSGDEYSAANLVVATGLNNVPSLPSYPNQGSYQGLVFHSAEYLNGSHLGDMDVLVVGFGNSAGEIALDLTEHGANTQISVRSPTLAVPLNVLGLPVTTVATWLSLFPPRLGDLLSRPLLALLIGDISKVGLPQSDIGPLELIATEERIPLVDVGTLEALREGRLTPRPGIDEFTPTGVRFSDGSSDDFGAVVFGTGYHPAIDRVLEDTEGLVDGRGRPLVSGGPTGVTGLYFCGFREVATGRLRRISVEAKAIAKLIAAGPGTDGSAND